ncbi:ribosome biogenesis GTPase Der [bacterium]|nr:ribosome biogenesis GTPase Der [bacterium]
MTSIVAIVGRPNVGKSTLFNRLSRSRDSLVDDTPGVTRDRLYASVRWNGKPFIIIDTGGFDNQGKELLADQIRDQVITAITESDRIIFMMDGRLGLMPGDGEVADLLRRSNKKVFTVVNKIDGPEQEHLIHEFFSLGSEKLYSLSAAHGYGLKALMEDVIHGLSGEDIMPEKDSQVRVAVLGRPNAGKSSLINRILGSDRLLVSESPGTTRDSIDSLFTYNEREYLLIDTAGIRRKSRVREKIDKFSMIKAIRSIDRCHVAVVLLDAGEGIAEQDARICGFAIDRFRGLVLAVNKWDLIRKDSEARRSLDNAIDRQLKFISFAPRINLSALTGERVKKLFEKIDLVYEHFCKRISTGELNRAVEEMIRKRPPPQSGRSRLKFFYATQTGIKPPTFIIFINRPKMVHFSYRRFMINQLRECFDLKHTPIRLIFRERRRH